MIIRGPKEVLLELLAVNTEIEKLEKLQAVMADSSEDSRELLRALIDRKLG